MPIVKINFVYFMQNKAMADYDYLIVGQGIAGTLLSYFLLKRNKNILIIDSLNTSSSSNVAAGLFNPITGRRNVKSWMVDDILPFAESTYREMEHDLQTKFYHKMNMYKLFSNVEEQVDWVMNSKSSDLKDYIATNNIMAIPPSNPSQFGGVELTKTGYVDMSQLLHAFKVKMEEEGRLLEQKMDYSDFSFIDGKVFFINLSFTKVIFCEGAEAIHNLYFSWLPFVLTKGEVLTIYSTEINLTEIVNKGIFILPLGNNTYKVGSTYEWNFDNPEPTSEGLNILTQKLDKIVNCKYEVMEHKAGIRPTVKDRRPFVGLHPTIKNMGIFNGLGTKGASLAPYFANHFVDYLECGKNLLKEVDIKRFL
jgi:glycine/D-amino acid oxidase-like deaminating enzyme